MALEDGSDLLTLRPVARMAQILGQHLIRDNTVGVLELVKNGYDADAENVTVELRNLSEPAETEIVIEDDGTGMDGYTIRGPWSEPAHGGKQGAKDALKRTRKGRLPLGEKGVGRFAAQKLGRTLEMVTRPEGGDLEFRVTIDWDEFDKSDAYLDQVGFPLESRPPEVFAGDRHGTRLLMKGSPTPWRRSNVQALQASMMRLLSPSKEDTDFAVMLRCPEYPELESLDRWDVLERYQFRIDCRINGKGVADYVYTHRKPDGGTAPVEESGVNLWAEGDRDWQKRDPACGPLRIILHSWLRPVSNLKEYGITRKQLDELCGVSIYRDGFRVIPYGDKGSDWLRLDIRRTNQPGQKYGNNQIIGQVEITQDENRELVDKTSREGLWENDAYDDMSKIVLAAVSRLETESMEERGRGKKPTETVKTLKAKVDDLQRQVRELKTRQPENSPTGAGPEPPEDDVTGPATIEVPVSKLETIEKRAGEIDSSVGAVIREYSEAAEEKREVFLHLMGLGLFAERFTHEFDRLVAGMSASLVQLEEKHPHYRWTKMLRKNTDQLKNEIRLLSTARYVRRPPQEQTISVRAALDMTLDAYRSDIERDDVRYDITGGDFEADISLASISQVLGNVVSNALYWLNRKSEVNERRMHIGIDARNRSIAISNNGGPVPRHIRRILFERPFVTTKPDGRGVGLYISGEIMRKANGKVDLLPESDPRNRYQSASFLISLREEKGREDGVGQSNVD